MARAQTLVRLVIALGVALLVAAAAAGWFVWKRPLLVDALFSRLALSRAGLAASVIEAPTGDLTVWSGGADGPTVVLLHGAGDQAGAWARVVPGLTGRFRVVIPDLPGHFKSDPAQGPLSVGMMLDAVEATVDACCPEERVTLVGNSLGAWLAFLVAHEQPERVDRVVAVNGGPVVATDTTVNLFPRTREEARATMRALTGPDTPEIPGNVLDAVARNMREGPAARLAETAGEMGRYLLEGRLDEVRVPVALVWGESDELFTPAYARRLEESLPAAELFLVERCGHVPHRECPGRFLEQLNRALAAPIEVEPEAPEPPAAAEEVPT